MRLLVALVVWVAAAVGGVALGDAIEHSVGTSSTSTSASGGGGSSSFGFSSSGSSAATFDASSVKASDAQSLFHAANLNKALNAARAQLGAGARLNNFVVYPGYLSITAVRGGAETNFYVDAQGSSHAVSSPGSPGTSSVFSLARVKADAPEVLSRRIAGLAHLPQSMLHYMVVETDPITGRLSWLIYPVQGATRIEYFEAAGARGPIREQLP